jgi:hypothetical protein
MEILAQYREGSTMPNLVSEGATPRFVSKGTVFLVVSCLIIFVTVSHAELYVIAHLPYGGGWSSRILAMNPGSEAVQVELKFFSKDGRPVSVPIGAGEVKDTQQFGVDPRAVKSLDIDAGALDSEAQIAWATVETSAPLQISSSIDSYSPIQLETGNGDNSAATGPPDQPPGRPPCIPPSELGAGKPPCIPPSVPGTTPRVRAQITAVAGAVSLPKGRGFQVPVSLYGSKGFNARFAFANPNQTTATIEVTLIRPEGHESVTRVQQIAPYGHISGMLTDPDFFEREIDPSMRFDGSVTICSDLPIGILALGHQGNLAFTLPVTASSRCPGGLKTPEDVKK